jgi:uncharacterized protein (DUF4415 family)/uncharacterized DUF497 family protein
VKIEFEAAKSARNAKERGLSFELAVDLDWDAAHTIEDQRQSYGETRRCRGGFTSSASAFAAMHFGSSVFVKPTGARRGSMPRRRPPLTDEEGEVRELTREDFRGMRPVREAMPALIEAMAEFRRKLGRPKAEAPKIHIGFRLASDVVASIKASGPGYNVRVEQALREAGFGKKIKRKSSLKITKVASAAKKRRSARQGTKPAVGKRRA